MIENVGISQQWTTLKWFIQGSTHPPSTAGASDELATSWGNRWLLGACASQVSNWQVWLSGLCSKTWPSCMVCRGQIAATPAAHPSWQLRKMVYLMIYGAKYWFSHNVSPRVEKVWNSPRRERFLWCLRCSCWHLVIPFSRLAVLLMFRVSPLIICGAKFWGAFCPRGACAVCEDGSENNHAMAEDES